MGKIKFISFMATLAFALALTLSCSGGYGSGDPSNSSGNGTSSSSGGVSLSPSSSSLAPNSSSSLVVTTGTFTDSRNGKVYKKVTIDTQTWMAENLNYNASGSKCYGNSESNCTQYGRLYNWATAKTACPSGWHLPSKAEWDVLRKAVGGVSTAGKHLKTKSGWNNNGNGLDTYGFSALPGGSYSGGGFANVGNYGFWWSSESYADSAPYLCMGYNIDMAEWSSDDKYDLLSVRCLQD